MGYRNPRPLTELWGINGLFVRFRLMAAFEGKHSTDMSGWLGVYSVVIHVYIGILDACFVSLLEGGDQVMKDVDGIDGIDSLETSKYDTKGHSSTANKANVNLRHFITEWPRDHAACNIDSIGNSLSFPPHILLSEKK